MTLFQAFILGITQGITEWLPISSSGHLVILEYLFGMKETLSFNIALHFASVIVIFIVFWKDIKKLIIGVLKRDKKALKMFFYYFLASIPAAIFGILLKDSLEIVNQNLFLIGIFLIITSFVLFVTKFAKKINTKINTKNSTLIGLAQACAILPGISRSGMTVSMGLVRGIDKKEVAKFSFILAIPAILGATLLDIRNLQSIQNVEAVIIGMIVCLIIGVLSLKFLLNIIKKNSLYKFSPYCLILGIFSILIFFFY
ncbi:undecaprenyl-diphosphate phosphatase [Patescibacteria group bacterium]|nr:undecaprenyl-diphosphate phosphatase [Patescibacteria group bacterium]